MINLNPNIGGSPNSIKGVWEHGSAPSKINADVKKSDFADTVRAVEKHLAKVDDLQQSSDIFIKDLLSGKNEDVISAVSAAAKADMSFKLLVSVRNKLIEAYKQTMNMPL